MSVSQTAEMPPSGPLQEPLALWRRLSLNQRFAVLAALSALVALLLVTLLWGRSPAYQVLFSNLSERDGGTVIAELQKLGVPYRIGAGGAVIEVPSDQVYATRMKLAANGLPKGGNVGFEVLEHQPFGTSQFVEQVNYQRALQGSLARTIESLSAVESATVHLAIPKPSVFLSQAEKPSASVLVKLRPGWVLARAQVAGIVHLVASSVPGLSEKSVTVVDQDGTMLSTVAEENGVQPTQQAYRAQVEQQYRKQIESILAPIAGSDGVRVAVAADLDFSKTESSNIVYGQGHVLSQQTQSSNSTGDGSQAMGVPGALSNQPPGNVVAPFTLSTASAPLTPQQFVQIAPSLKALAPTSASSSATVNYELDKTVSHTQGAVGAIKRLSVSVLVNQQIVEGKPKPMTAEQIAQIKQLVESAMGFDAKRGDQVSVVSMAFSGAEADQKETVWWRAAWFWELVRLVAPYVVALVLGLLAFMAIRRLAAPTVVHRVAEPGLAAEGGGAEPGSSPASAEATVGAASEAGEEGAAAGAPAAEPGPSGELKPDVVRLTNTYESDAAVARELVKQDPRRAAQVIKEWLGDGK